MIALLATIAYFAAIAFAWWYGDQITADTKAVCGYLSAIWLMLAAIRCRE